MTGKAPNPHQGLLDRKKGLEETIAKLKKGELNAVPQGDGEDAQAAVIARLESHLRGVNTELGKHEKPTEETPGKSKK